MATTPGPGPAGDLQAATNPGARVWVDTAVIMTAACVLDLGGPTAAPAAGAPRPGGLPDRLREAAGADGHRTPLALRGAPPPAAGRIERDLLAAAIATLLEPQRRRPLRQVDAALVHESVQALRRETVRWADEPLAPAARRRWEHLHLCIPLTAVITTTDTGDIARR